VNAFSIAQIFKVVILQIYLIQIFYNKNILQLYFVWPKTTFCVFRIKIIK